MKLETEQSRQAAGRSDHSPAPGTGEPAELDLDRLVWDPEYRAAMQPLLRDSF